MRRRNIAIGLFVFFAMVNALCQAQTKTVLFVCEHGSAKSIIAAAHFKKLAEEQGLKIRVISRGINPDPLIPEAINLHLESDGFERQTDKPIQLENSDLENSDYVVAFNPIPEKYNQTKNIKRWNIPSFEAGYPVARDSILTNIQRIIVKIKSDNKK